MCYMTVLSTSSPLDLSQFDTSLVKFSKQLPGIPEEVFLQHQHHWYLVSQHQCSCGFRHLDRGNEDILFSAPVDWWPEEPEDLEATKHVVRIFKNLSQQGEKLDCVDAWVGNEREEPSLDGTLVVNLAEVKDDCFRFSSGHRFEFVYAT